MVRPTQIVASLMLCTGISALVTKDITCPNGENRLIGVELGGGYDVCCPGDGVKVDGHMYCCVGHKNDKSSSKKNKRLCISVSDDCDGDDDDDNDNDNDSSKTATCATAVAATAGDFSSRVSAATATGTGSPSRATDNAAGMITAAPWVPWAVAAGGVAAAMA